MSKKYLSFRSVAEAHAFSHQVAVHQGHDPESKDDFFPVIPAPRSEADEDTGAFLEVEEGKEVFLTQEQKTSLIDESEFEEGDTFPHRSIVHKGAFAAKKDETVPEPEKQPAE